MRRVSKIGQLLKMFGMVLALYLTLAIAHEMVKACFVYTGTGTSAAMYRAIFEQNSNLIGTYLFCRRNCCSVRTLSDG